MDDPTAPHSLEGTLGRECSSQLQPVGCWSHHCMDRQTDRQIDRQTDRRTDKCISMVSE